MDKIIASIQTAAADESGVTAIEYGLLAALIVVAIVGAVSATGDSVTDIYTVWSAAVINAIQGAL